MCWAEKNSLTSLRLLFRSHSTCKIFTFTKGILLAQSADPATLDLRVVGSGPLLGVEITLKINK